MNLHQIPREGGRTSQEGDFARYAATDAITFDMIRRQMDLLRDNPPREDFMPLRPHQRDWVMQAMRYDERYRVRYEAMGQNIPLAGIREEDRLREAFLAGFELARAYPRARNPRAHARLPGGGYDPLAQMRILGVRWEQPVDNEPARVARFEDRVR